MTITKSRTVCDPNCHANPKCGLTATVEDGKIIAIDAADYPVPEFENRICQMGRSRIEYQYHEARLRTPLKRVGERGEGKWQPIGWNEAAELFVEKQKSVIEKYGSKAVAFTAGSGSYALLTRGSVTRYAALTGATATNPASGYDVGVPRGFEYMFGLPAASFFLKGGHEFSDAINSEVVLIWGVNPAVTRSVDHAPLKAARQAGAKLVCIDPTRSESSGWCDQWISPRPGSDGALALAMANWIIKNDHIDEAFLTAYTDMPFLVKESDGSLLRESDFVEGGSASQVVWCNDANAAVPVEQSKATVLEYSGELRTKDGIALEVQSVFSLHKAMVAEYSLELSEDITGVSADVIRTLASEYATAKPGAIRVGYGLDRYYYADTTARSIALLACLTGNIGVSGGGISLHEGTNVTPVRGRNFYSPEGKYPTYLTFPQLDAAVRHQNPYPVKMECISISNSYLMSRPGYRNHLDEYLEQLEFITVIDHFMTDTAKWADLVLPACTIFERTDIVVDRLIQLQQRVVEPEGEAKSDFEIFGLFAKKMGLGEYFSKSAEEYIGDTLDSDHPLMQDVTIERLLDEKVIHAGPPKTEPYIGFKNRVFPTRSGRIECYKEELVPYGSEVAVYREPIEASPKNPLFDRYPLVLLSSHSRYRIHSQFANTPMMREKEPEPILRVSPEDASCRGIADGSMIYVHNDRGNLKIRCYLDDKMRSGTVLIEEGHWEDQFVEGEPYSLLHNHTNPTSDNYFQYDVLVEIKAVNVDAS